MAVSECLKALSQSLRTLHKQGLVHRVRSSEQALLQVEPIVSFLESLGIPGVPIIAFLE